MHVARLRLHDFRSYPEASIEIGPGKVSFVGANGQGKTNLVEAIDYLSSLSSHRVSSDIPLVRHGTDGASVAADVMKHGRNAELRIEIRPGAANRAFVNGAAIPRARDMVGTLQTVVFAPDDLTLVKGDPSARRHFLDTLAALRTPRVAGDRADYDRVLKQRNALLKSARQSRLREAPPTLEAWDDHLTRLGAAVTHTRLKLLTDLAPHLEQAYANVAALAAQNRRLATAEYFSRTDIESAEPEDLQAAITEQIEQRRREELDRGITLVGPHRDDVVLTLGDLPAKGYASHGETWSFALALRLAAFDLLREDGDDPVLILDDVFAELDRGRREELAGLVDGIEQVLVTAAVAEDVPAAFSDRQFVVQDGRIDG